MSALKLKWEDLYIQEGPSKGYVDIKNIIEKTDGYPFLFFVGARGIGKTYGAMDLILTENIPTVFMRRSQVQCDTISSNEMFQGAKYCKDNSISYDIKTLVKNAYGVYFNESEYPQMVQVALTTMCNVRGFDMSDRTLLVYDEFLPEKHSKAIRNEGAALLNAYETINRNRELDGEAPLKMIAMSNSDRLDNPLFADFNLITACEKQFRKGQIYYADAERGVCVINFVNSPISDKKRETALYRFSKGMDFESMALDNEFGDEISRIGSANLKSLIPAINLGEITLYKHKDTNEIYVSSHYMKGALTYENTEKSLLAWRKSDLCRGFYYMYLHNELIFESYNCEYLFKRYCENK